MATACPATVFSGSRMSAANALAARKKTSTPMMKSCRIVCISLGGGSIHDIVVYDNPIAVNSWRDVVVHAYSERNWNLRTERLIDVAVRNPNHFTGIVVVGGQHLGNVDKLTALIHQFALKNRVSRIGLVQLLMQYSDDRIGRRGNQNR